MVCFLASGSDSVIASKFRVFQFDDITWSEKRMEHEYAEIAIQFDFFPVFVLRSEFGQIRIDESSQLLLR
ncbi:hypothetical protein PvtlMGM2_1934 [Prevotella sp. MGM2]|nr:hypothetical protein PvtlMGM2_1934 [Prevotella sp. MGM2]